MSVLERLRRWRAAPADEPGLSLENHPLMDRAALAEARRMMRRLSRQQARTPKWDSRRAKLTDELRDLAVDVYLMDRAQQLRAPTTRQVDAIRDDFYALDGAEKVKRLREVIG